MWFNLAAAQHHVAVCSLPRGGMRRRTGNKMKLMSWDKNYLIKRKGKWKQKYNNSIYVYKQIYPQSNCSPTQQLHQHPAPCQLTTNLCPSTWCHNIQNSLSCSLLNVIKAVSLPYSLAQTQVHSHPSATTKTSVCYWYCLGLNQFCFVLIDQKELYFSVLNKISSKWWRSMQLST